MDKYEYNLRNEEINALIGRREFQKAVAIADTIDWTKVRSVKTLCKISDLYKVNRRYNESKILLEQALDRCPTGKTIVSSLCELCIRMGDVVGAMQYYKLFVEMAPTDNLKFILLYKIYEMQEASLDERIEVLEELKKRERIEKWCYELAYLYHRIGLTTRCVEECDDLILWFREGKFVKKAMELKMLHQQLTQSQEALYQNMLDPVERMTYMDQVDNSQVQLDIQESFIEEPVQAEETDDVLVKTVDVGQYSTMNIQKALEESIKGSLNEEAVDPNIRIELADDRTILFSEEDIAETEKQVASEDKVAEAILAPMMQDTGEMQELFFEAENTGELELDDIEEEIKVPEVEVSISEAVEEEAKEAEEVVEELEEYEEPVTSIEDSAYEQEITVSEAEEIFNDERTIIQPIEKAVSKEEDIRSQVAFPDMPVSEDTIIYNKGDITNQVVKEIFPEEAEEPKVAPVNNGIDMSSASKEELMELIDRKVAEAIANAMNGLSMTAGRPAPRSEMSQVAPPVSMQKMLSQEYDGQISLVVPEEEKVEKQITGQINLDDYLSNWENTKRESQKKHEEEIKQRLLEETGSLFDEFEIKARDSILEKIETGEINTEKAPIDADKEYEEYLKKIMAEENANNTEEASVETNDLPEIEELEEIEEIDATSEEAADNVGMDSEECDDLEYYCEDNSKAEADEESEDGVEEIEELEEEAETIEESIETEAAKEEEAAEETEASEEPEAVKEPEAAEETEAAEEVKESKEADEIEEELEDIVEPTDADRDLTEEEAALFSQFVQTKRAKASLTRALDSISLASHTGNVFVTGDAGDEPLELAKNVVQYAKSSDENFSGKIGKVTGASLNGKDVIATVERLSNGGLIIEKPGDMNADTAKTLIKVLNKDNLGILVVMQDTKAEMKKLFAKYNEMGQLFNVHIQIEELSDDALVAYGRKYAEHMEYAIDEMGILALHTRIDEMQTSDHIVTVSDVRDIVDSAIEHATKFSPKHITDVLLGKRYDDDDMIILKERDFTN